MTDRNISVRTTMSEPVRLRYSDISLREPLAGVAAGAERFAGDVEGAEDEAQERAEAGEQQPAPVIFVPAASIERHQK